MAYKAFAYMLLCIAATSVFANAEVENNRCASFSLLNPITHDTNSPASSPNLIPRSYSIGYSAPYVGVSSVVLYSSVGVGVGGFSSLGGGSLSSIAPAAGASSQPFSNPISSQAGGVQQSSQPFNAQSSPTPGFGSPRGGARTHSQVRGGQTGSGAPQPTSTNGAAGPVVTAGLMLGAVVGGMHFVL